MALPLARFLLSKGDPPPTRFHDPRHLRPRPRPHRHRAAPPQRRRLLIGGGIALALVAAVAFPPSAAGWAREQSVSGERLRIAEVTPRHAGARRRGAGPRGRRGQPDPVRAGRRHRHAEDAGRRHRQAGATCWPRSTRPELRSRLTRADHAGQPRGRSQPRRRMRRAAGASSRAPRCGPGGDRAAGRRARPGAQPSAASTAARSAQVDVPARAGRAEEGRDRRRPRAPGLAACRARASRSTPATSTC